MLNLGDQLNHGLDRLAGIDFQDSDHQNSSEAYSQSVSQEIEHVMSQFPVKYVKQQKPMDEAFRELNQIPKWYWESDDINNQTIKALRDSVEGIEESLWASVGNSVFIHFEIDPYKDIDKNETGSPTTKNATESTSNRLTDPGLVSEEIRNRAEIVV